MMGILMDGGWMMLPLLFCSIGMLAVLIDRARAFRTAGYVDPEKVRTDVREKLLAHDLDGAEEVCKASDGPVAATLLAGILRYKHMLAKGKSEQEIEAGVTKAMEDYAPKSMKGLEARLGSLVLISSIAPLLGMTGTVTGMINSFAVMAEAAGLDAGAVAGGISEALITTAAGLLVAIPGVVAYNMFQRRVEDWNTQLESAIADVVQCVGA